MFQSHSVSFPNPILFFCNLCSTSLQQESPYYCNRRSSDLVFVLNLPCRKVAWNWGIQRSPCSVHIDRSLSCSPRPVRSKGVDAQYLSVPQKITIVPIQFLQEVISPLLTQVSFCRTINPPKFQVVQNWIGSRIQTKYRRHWWNRRTWSFRECSFWKQGSCLGHTQELWPNHLWNQASVGTKSLL